MDELWCVVFNVFWKLACCKKFAVNVDDGWIYICEKQRFLETGFWRVAEFCVEMKIDGKICGMSFLSSHVHARQQTPNLFQPGFISTTLWTFVNVSASCMEATGNDVFAEWDVYVKQRLHGRFSALFSRDDFCSGIWCSSTVHVNRMKEPNDSYRN